VQRRLAGIGQALPERFTPRGFVKSRLGGPSYATYRWATTRRNPTWPWLRRCLNEMMSCRFSSKDQAGEYGLRQAVPKRLSDRITEEERLLQVSTELAQGQGAHSASSRSVLRCTSRRNHHTRGTACRARATTPWERVRPALDSFPPRAERPRSPSLSPPGPPWFGRGAWPTTTPPCHGWGRGWV
jgi:hypothetical protein